MVGLKVRISKMDLIMYVKNPYYNPDWEAIHDYHSEHRSRLMIEMEKYYAGPHSPSERIEFRKLQKEFDFHQATCLHILTRVQHKTVPDFARWWFEGLSFRIDISAVPPYETFQSMDEVHELYKALDDEYSRESKEQMYHHPRSLVKESADSYDDCPSVVDFRPSIWQRVTGIFH